MNSNETNGSRIAAVDTEESVELPRQRPQIQAGPALIEDRADTRQTEGHATREGLNGKPGIEKSKLIMLVGGLLAAVLFFVFTTLVNHSSATKKTAEKQLDHRAEQQTAGQSKGSVTPLMESVHPDDQESSNGQIHPGDIKRTSTPATANGETQVAGSLRKPRASGAPSANSLGAIPSFADTQQKWEEPQPYGEASHASPVQAQQSSNALKEASLVFVHSQPQSQPLNAGSHPTTDAAPMLEMTPGSRIEAKLETQISSAVQAPVVAVVEYTYAIGDRIVVPAGARVYGQLQQADKSGFVGVKFDEIELIGGEREKIEAIGAGLDLGPIKGTVFGKNTGKNLFVRAASGMGSLAATLVGNNSSAALSEEDILRERVAENIGDAGESELMSLNLTSRVVVSVPADTRIYIVFTRHDDSQAGLHKVAGQ